MVDAWKKVLWLQASDWTMMSVCRRTRNYSGIYRDYRRLTVRQTYMYAFLLDLLVALGLLALNQARSLSCRRYASRPLQASVEIASGLVLTNDALDVLCI